ncbi:hypothetical protein [Sphingobacterium sp. LRF_L2]|uniref:hypothetical protein n=1 Tax=Sphingobacterium sp. LRF_L2 TaxID=3369421 RepID=UPI003F613A56
MNKIAIIVGGVLYMDRDAFNILVAKHDIFILLHPERIKMNDIAIDLHKMGKVFFFLESWRDRNKLPQEIGIWKKQNLTIVP